MKNLPFGFDRPEDSLGFLLWQATVVWHRRIKRALESYNISHAQFVVMAVLMWLEANEYDITQTLIVNKTKLDKMTVSKTLKTLVALGFVSRVEHEDDARAKSIALTDQGKNMVYILVPIVEDIDAQFFGSIAGNEEKQFAAMLVKLIGDSNE
jgi:DNA-binding MarR family transcriptional regulator